MFTKIKNWLTKTKQQTSSVDLLYTFNLHYKLRIARNDSAPGNCFDSVDLEAKVRASSRKEAVQLLRATVRRAYEMQIIVWDDKGLKDVLYEKLI